MAYPGQNPSYGAGITRIVGADGTEAGVDGSGALRTVGQDEEGVALARVPTGTFCAPIWFKQAAGTASGQVVWQLTATSLELRIREIFLQLSWDGTASAGNTALYNWCIGTAAATTRPSGGTTFTPVCTSGDQSGGFPASTAHAQYLATGLTTTGFTYQGGFAVAAIPVSVSAKTEVMPMKFGGPTEAQARLWLPNEDLSGTAFALALRIGGLAAQATFAGVSGSGYVLFDEPV